MAEFNIHMIDNEHYLFGNKGAVWTNKIHIAKINNNNNGGSLCGTPMLSTNWAGFEKNPQAGCEKCLEIYNNNKKQDE